MNRCSGIKNLKSKLNLDEVVRALNDSMKLAEANNRRREVGFLSQAVIESDYFRTFEEYGKRKGKDYYPYYGRGHSSINLGGYLQGLQSSTFPR